MADDDLSGYESGPIEADERRRMRRDFKRVDALWSTFGPITGVARNWKFWLGMAGILAWLNRPEIMAALQVILGGGQ